MTRFEHARNAVPTGAGLAATVVTLGVEPRVSQSADPTATTDTTMAAITKSDARFIRADGRASLVRFL